MNMEFLQHYWWILISLLGGLLVFLLFVQGGQTLLYTIAKTDDERNLLVNSLGRKWEFTFTTLVVFGGAFFASFPLFYSTSFGGAYLAWMVVLFCFVMQAVSYEYRRKAGNLLGEKTYNIFLIINGVIGTICIGAVVGSFFTGNPFKLGEMNDVTWMSPWRGIEVLFNVANLCLGLAIFFLARTLAALYFMNNIKHDVIIQLHSVRGIPTRLPSHHLTGQRLCDHGRQEHPARPVQIFPQPAGNAFEHAYSTDRSYRSFIRNHPIHPETPLEKRDLVFRNRNRLGCNRLVYRGRIQ